MRPSASSSHLFRPLVVLLLLLSTGCGGGDSTSPPPTTTTPPPPVRTPASLAASAGDAQQAAGGATVPVAPAVLVRDAAGQPLAGVAVTFTVTDGGGQLAGASPTTDATGVARVTSWTLGPNGAQRVRASVGTLTPVTFTATLTRGSEQYVHTVGSTGGTLTITQPGYAFDGLTLTVPAGAVSEGTRWEFRELPDAPALTLPTGYARIGPVLEIVTNQSRASDLLTLDVPLPAAPSGTALLLALRDPVSGAMELLPLVDRTATSARVATQHLRGDLLLGATPPSATTTLVQYATRMSGRATARVDAPASITIGLSPAQLITIAVSQPFTAVSGLRNAWPVREHGSAAHPDGHGPAIALFEMRASMLDFTASLASIVQALDRDGHYLEAGPLAAVSMAEQQVGGQVRQSLGQFSTLLAQVPAVRRDSLLHQVTAAAVGASGRMIAAAHRLPGSGRFLFSSVTAGDAGGLTLTPGAQLDALQLAFRAQGFASTMARALATRPPEQVQDVVPLSSFLVDYRPITTLLRSLESLGAMPAGSIERIRANLLLARAAGLPELRFELEALAGGGRFVVPSEEELVLRTPATRIHVGINGASLSFSLHDLQGLTLATGTDRTEPAEDVPALAALSTTTPTPLAFSAAIDNVAGSLQQVTTSLVRALRAPFEVTPARDTVGPGDLHVTFEASVPRPPSDGFRLEWDWGDGTTSENLGVTTATHEYATAKNYRVVVTLRDVARTAVLAVDTVEVIDAPGQWVGSVTGTVLSVESGGVTHFTATDVTWSPQAGGENAAGWTRFRVTGGLLRYWREVPCANYVSTVRELPLGGGTYPSNFLFVSEVGLTFTGESVRQYYGQAFRLDGPRLTNKLCIEPFRPDPEEYEFSGPPIFFQAGPLPLGSVAERTTDPDVLSGTFTQVSTGGGLRSTWTWHFERRR